MAIAEMPLDVSTFSRVGGPSAVLGNHALRVCQNLSFYIDVNSGTQYLYSLSSPTLMACVGYGSLTGIGGAGDQFTISGGLGAIGTGVTQILQVYFSASGAVTTAVVSSTSAAFPGGVVPLATVTMDAVGRIQSVIDSRSSSLAVAPTIGAGTMFEVVSDATKRAAFAANYSVPRTYSLGPTIPPDLALPCPGFFLGAGSVNTGSVVVNTGKTYVSCGSTPNNTPSLTITTNAVNQLYINTSGVLSTQVVAATGLAFPANSLAIAEVVTDAVALIRQINDLRPSYI